jgi:hypothetical protein
MTAHITIFSTAAVLATLALPASAQNFRSPQEQGDARALALEELDGFGPNIEEIVIALD